MRLPILLAATVLALSLPIVTLLAAPARRANTANTAPADPPASSPASPAPAAQVQLAPHPGTPLDAAARALLAQDLAEARRAGEVPLVLIGTAALGSASDRLALFIQLQSPRECGSAGCSTSVYLWQNGAYKRVLDGVGGVVSAGPTRTRGMADLTTDKDRYVWNGQQYKDARPAPAIDLRRRG